jgi:hypothetical protein
MQEKNSKSLEGIPEKLILTDVVLANIERRMSAERLAPYLRIANQDRRYALHLYQWNTDVSVSLYGLLQGFEVVLRNTFHEILSGAFARTDWYAVAALDAEGRQSVAKARTRLAQENKAITPGRVVAEMNFGFWVSLLRPRYAQTLWDPHLHRSFRMPLKRDNAYHTLDRIRKLRNRVAHHEIIVGRNLMDDYATIFQYLRGICPDTAGWIKSGSTFVSTYKSRPMGS